VDWKRVLDVVDEILEFFESEGVKPTVRTIFYQLVARGVLPLTRSRYKQLSRKLVEARMKGRYSWDFVEDKVRSVIGFLYDLYPSDDEPKFFETSLQLELEKLDIERMIEEIFHRLKPTIDLGRWAKQPYAVEIWIEKEALSSTIVNWTRNLEIPVKICKGYPSWTFIYKNVQEIKYTLRHHDKIAILYLGDLDPSGVDIERFLKKALEYFQIPKGKVEFKRIAVTQEQIEKYNLPPRPKDAETLAKLLKDTRYKKYKIPYVVELDALVAYAPSQFRKLLINTINSYWNKNIYQKELERTNKIKNKIEKLIEEYKIKAKKKILETLKGESEKNEV